MNLRPLLCILLLGLLGWSCQRQDNSPEAAAAYNEAIVQSCDSVTRAFDAFNESVDVGDAAKAEQRLQLTIMAAERARKKVAGMEAFDGNTELRDASTDLLNYYHRALEKGFRPLLPVLLADTLDEQQAIRADSLISDFVYMEDSLFAQLFTAQALFSKKYGLTLH